MSVNIEHITYRTLSTLDVEAICDLHRAAFAPDTRDMTIFCSDKVSRYLLDIMAKAPRFKSEVHEFVGAVFDQHIVAYAHFRRLGDFWHLNQIAVHPDFQGQGIGNRLVRMYFDRATYHGMKMLSLDVYADNERLVKWYSRLGFRKETTHFFYKIDVDYISLHQGSIESDVVEWNETLELRKLYGFSKIKLRFGDNIFEVGWLCRSLRVYENTPEVVIRDALRLAPGVERILLVTSLEVSPRPFLGSQWRPAGSTIRMIASAHDLKSR